MCEYCGCRQVEPIAELMDEHLTLLEIAGDLRRSLLEQQLTRALAERDRLVDLLGGHTRREEAGVFAALRQQGDFVEQVDELEREHVSLDKAVAALELGGPTALDDLAGLIGDLTLHIDKEDLGIFPVAIVTLGATGWATVDRARTAGHDHPHHASHSHA